MDVYPTNLASGPGWARLKLSGDIDLASVEAYRDLVKATVAGEPKVVLVDLAAVPFMDSSGLGLLADLARGCPTAQLYVLDAPEIVDTAIRTCGLDQYLTLVAGDDVSVSDALSGALNSADPRADV